MEAKRVVITGIGTINALGHNAEETWKKMKEGQLGIDTISAFDASELKVSLAAEVKNLNVTDYIPVKAAKRTERFVQLASIAANEAVSDAGLNMEQEDAYRVGVCVSSAIGGLERIAKETIVAHEKSASKVNPFTVPLVISNMVSANIAMAYGCQGKCIGVVSACSSGTDSIGEAYNTILSGQCDIMITGGSDSCICLEGITAFQQMHALTTTEDKNKASIPFDAERSGFVMGEGAGVLILEELSHAKKRNATIYGEIIGYGCTNDAHHITCPREDGQAAAKAMELAIQNSNITKEQINYVNAHGTSTHFNDLCETRAMKQVFGTHAYKLSINSTKSMLGHTLAGAGAIEAIVCLLSMRDSYVH
ncbi:MAG: beta-ketoacyl-[acyl-carrier-protein] synthase II [Lachnospiraceae bacterium]|nr:beta-ketoacyl-[acyl-carrier-protein] synthase II [Lachnospiraceae bacterium]